MTMFLTQPTQPWLFVVVQTHVQAGCDLHGRHVAGTSTAAKRLLPAATASEAETGSQERRLEGLEEPPSDTV